MNIPSPIIVITIVLLLLIYLAVVITTTLLYHKANRHYLDKYSSEMSEQLKRSQQELENHNKILTNEMIRVIQSQQEELQSHRHLDKELFSTFIKIKQAIKSYCYSTASDINAGRLAIYLFHNGTSSTHGVSFVKMSCICEKVAIGSGVRERMMDHSNIPINLFDDMAEELIDAGKYIIMGDDQSCSETLRRLFISSHKIKYTQLVSIYDADNTILGFVCAEMSNDYSRESALEEKAKIDMLISQIRPVLSFSDYKNVTVEANPINNVQHD